MNRLATSKRLDILGNLIGGKSIRSTARTCGVSINTVSKLLDDAAAAYHDEHVRGIRGRRQIKCCQTWAFSVDDEGAADAWTFIGIDADSRLIVSQLVGVDVRHATIAFMYDLRSRLLDSPRLMTGGLDDSAHAVDLVFGAVAGNGKSDGKPRTADVPPHRPPIRPEMASRRVEKHGAIAQLYALHHNFCQSEKKLRTTPAMESGLDDAVRDMAWIVGLIDERSPKPNRPKTYRRRSGSPD